LYFTEEHSKKLDQNEINKFLYQAKALDLEWHEAFVDANIEFFEISHEKSVSYFKCLENLEKIRCTNSPGPATLPVHEKKRVTANNILAQSFKNPKASSMWCHDCEKKTNKVSIHRLV
jgi:hypothetical protein